MQTGPFDLSLALKGAKYGFRGLDKPVAILCVSDTLSDGKTIVSSYEDKGGKRLITHFKDGRFMNERESHLDLVMLEPESIEPSMKVYVRLQYISDIYTIVDVLDRLGCITSRVNTMQDLISCAGSDGRRDCQSIGKFEENIAKQIYSHLTLASIPAQLRPC